MRISDWSSDVCSSDLRAFFIWVSLYNLFVVSIFWSFMADLFRSEQGKRLFGFIAAGGTAGAVLGPTLTATLAGPLGPLNLLLVSALLLELAVQCVRRRSEEQTSELQSLMRHSYAVVCFKKK